MSRRLTPKGQALQAVDRGDEDELRGLERLGLAAAGMYLPRALKHIRWARLNINTVRHAMPVTAARRGMRTEKLHRQMVKLVLTLGGMEKLCKDSLTLATHLWDETGAERKGAP